MDADTTLHRLQEAAAREGRDLTAFRPEFVVRRLRRSAILAGQLFVDREVTRLLEDPQALHRFLDDLSVGVSAFFRDRLSFALLEERVLPRLRRSFDSLRVWSAACAHGQEAWSLAMLLAEEPTPFQLWASDRNDGFLEKARRAIYPDAELRELTRHRYATHLRSLPDGTARIADPLRRQVSFALHDLSQGVLPEAGEGGLHLVLCRNVLIYLGASARQRLCEDIARLLVPGGYLLLGSAEHLPPGIPLTPVDLEARLFRRDET